MSLQVALLLSTSGFGGGRTGILTTNASTYAVGDTVTATVTNGPAGAQNAVGLYYSTDDPSTAMPLDWKYLTNNARTPTPSAGVANGSVTLSLAGLTPDNYDVALVDAPLSVSSVSNFYVSGSGNDSFDGHSTLTAWKTIAKVNSYAAATHFQPGDQILFEGGTTFAGSLSFTSTSWTGAIGSHHITIGSYGTGRATISSGALNGLSIINNSGVLVQELNFVGNGTTDIDGVLVQNKLTGAGKLPYVYLYNLDVTGYGRNGVAVLGGYGPTGTGTDTAGFDEVTVDGVTSHGNTNIYAGNSGSGGIVVQGLYGFNAGLTNPTHTNVSIINCVSYNNVGHANADWSGCGIFIADTQTGLIEFCEAHDNGASNNDASWGAFGIFTYDAHSIMIQSCESHHNRTASANNGGGFAINMGSTNAAVRFCYSHDNDGPGYTHYQDNDSFVPHWDNNSTRFCISENDGIGVNPAVMFASSNNSPLSYGDFYNNTVYKASAGTIISIRGSLHIGLVTNNILYSVADAWLVNTAINPTGLSFRGNDYWATGTWRILWNNVTYSTLPAWRTATTQETHTPGPGEDLGQSIDPLLNDPGNGGTVGGLLNVDVETGNILPPILPEYQLQDGSQMIDKGLNLFKLFNLNPGTRDFYMTDIPQGFTYDVGACESFSGTLVSEFNEDWTGTSGPWDSTRWIVQQFDDDVSSSIVLQGNAGLMTVGGHVHAWARAGSIVNAMADFDLRVTVQLSSVGEQYHTLQCRAQSGTSRPEWSDIDPFRPLNGYEIGIYDYSGGRTFGFFPIVSDAYGTGVEVAKTWGTGLWNIHVQMIGSAIKAKAWQGTEPGTWDIQVTNTLYATGHFMIGAMNGGDAVTRSATWDTLSIAAPSASVSTFSDTFTGTIGSSWDPVKWPAQLGKPGTASKVSLQAPQGSANADVGELYVAGSANTWARASSNCTDMGNFNLTCTIRMQFPGEQYHKIFTRSAGGWNQTGEPWRPTEGFEIAMVYLGTGEGRLYFTPIYQDELRFVSQLSVAKDWGTATWNMRIQMIGSALNIKAWQGTEPGTWDITTTYNPVGGSFITGTLRVSSTNGANGNTVNCKFDNMLVVAA